MIIITFFTHEFIVVLAPEILTENVLGSFKRRCYQKTSYLLLFPMRTRKMRKSNFRCSPPLETITPRSAVIFDVKRPRFL